MTSSTYQSPISPGISWYEDSCGERPQYPPLDGDVTCDVVIIGGGYCGLSAALELARNGTSVVLIEQHRLGDGASGRNGGQMGTGQRSGVTDAVNEFGFERAKALFDLAEEAKHSLINTATFHKFETGYQSGQLTPMHKKRFEKAERAEAELLAARFEYPHLSWLDRNEMAQAIGSSGYFGGTRDSGTGHIHPLKYLIGLAKAVAKSGAQIHEQTAAISVQSGEKIIVKTATGTITADRCLMALNGYHDDIDNQLARHVMPIQSFIGATVPLPDNTPVLPGGEAVADSRFVVRYFRKSADNRLLFGGREAYGKSTPGDIRRTIRKQITEIYPELSNIQLTHAWGGNVAITMPRQPFVREVEPGIWVTGGFSGHGVMLANYTGRLIGEAFLGRTEKIKLFTELKIPAFPGGTLLRNPLKILALTWYAMLDRI